MSKRATTPTRDKGFPTEHFYPVRIRLKLTVFEIYEKIFGQTPCSIFSNIRHVFQWVKNKSINFVHNTLTFNHTKLHQNPFRSFRGEDFFSKCLQHRWITMDDYDRCQVKVIADMAFG